MATRREILLKARKAQLDPAQRQVYCASCSAATRENYQTALILPGAGTWGALGSLGPALVAQLLLGCHPTTMHYQADPLSSSPDGTVAPPRQGPAMNYARRNYDTSPLGFKENKPFTARGALTAPVRLRQPKRQRDFLRDEPNESHDQEPVAAVRENYQATGPAVNPWAVCHASTGAKKTSKFERCVQDVKQKTKS